MYEHGAIGRKFSFHEAVSAFIQLSIRRIKGKKEICYNCGIMRISFLRNCKESSENQEIIGIGYDERHNDNK